MPKIILVLGVPAVAFAVTVGISLGTDSSNDAKPAAVPTVAVAVTNRQPLPAAAPQQQTAQATPDVTAPADRTECSAIRGTDYRSTAEQDWFKKNCGAGSSNTASVSTGGGASTGGGTSASAATQASTAPRQAAVSGAEVPSGQRLVIPAANINADVNVTKMGGFDMPDPKGYFNVLAYDMSGLAGFGSDGTPNGNLVISGHVDCGRCYNGGSGTAVFWNARNLKPGDSAQVYTADGKVVNYLVTRSSAVGSGFNWDSIIQTSAADMTIITCTGTFNSATHEYDQRHYVSFKKA
jgi:hypothetical protein